MAYEKDPAEIGALWTKTGGKGTYMTGTILGQRVVVFSIQKRGDKSPDWRVLKAKPRDDADQRQKPSEDEAPW
jgi:hypothetical protein